MRQLDAAIVKAGCEHVLSSHMVHGALDFVKGRVGQIIKSAPGVKERSVRAISEANDRLTDIWGKADELHVELELDAQNIAFLRGRCDGYADMSVFQKNFEATEKELRTLADRIDEIRIFYVERPAVLDGFWW